MSYDLGPLGIVDFGDMARDAGNLLKKTAIGIGIIGTIGGTAAWMLNADDVVKSDAKKAAPVPSHKPIDASKQHKL